MYGSDKYSSVFHPDLSALTGTVPSVMGTSLSVLICGIDETFGKTVFDEMASEALRLDVLLSRFNPESEIYRLNANSDSGWQEACPEVLETIQTCREYNKRTLGLFDITKGNPLATEIGDGKVNLNGAALDFGGYAKGLFLERALSLIKESGITGAFICFGQSSTLAVGSHPCGKGWKVSVSSPFNNRTVAEVELRDSSLSVSGNRPGYDNHIYNPHTGLCCKGRRMAVVTSGSPLDAEVLSTAAMSATETELEKLRSGFKDSAIDIYE